ncbi:unnamed protein product [Diplocarpon coronariae]
MPRGRPLVWAVRLLAEAAAASPVAGNRSASPLQNTRPGDGRAGETPAPRNTHGRRPGAPGPEPEPQPRPQASPRPRPRELGRTQRGAKGRKDVEEIWHRTPTHLPIGPIEFRRGGPGCR